MQPYMTKTPDEYSGFYMAARCMGTLFTHAMANSTAGAVCIPSLLLRVQNLSLHTMYNYSLSMGYCQALTC